MKRRFAALTVVAVLSTAGISMSCCQQQTDAGVRTESIPAGNPGSSPPIATRKVGIDDPTLGVNFMTYTIPKDWIFQGGIRHGTSCHLLDTPFFRISSPNGLTGVKVFPRSDFTWSNLPTSGRENESGCTVYQGEIKASSYLDHLISGLHVEVVNNLNDSALARQIQNQVKQPGGSGLTFADTASALTRFNINAIKEEEEITVVVRCWGPSGLHSNMPGHCTVDVRLTWSPEGKVLSTVATMMAIMKPEQGSSYEQAWLKRYTAQFTAVHPLDPGDHYFSFMNLLIVADGEAFREQMKSEPRSGERSESFSPVREPQMADDLCDKALSQQAIFDSATDHVSWSDNGHTYNWVSADGKQHFASHEINDNPNGRGNGDWVMTTSVNASSDAQ